MKAVQAEPYNDHSPSEKKIVFVAEHAEEGRIYRYYTETKKENVISHMLVR